MYFYGLLATLLEYFSISIYAGRNVSLSALTSFEFWVGVLIFEGIPILFFIYFPIMLGAMVALTFLKKK